MKAFLRAFLRGAGSILSIWPCVEVPTISDEEALAGDWQRVGDDIRLAMRKFDESERK